MPVEASTEGATSAPARAMPLVLKIHVCYRA